MIRKFMMIQVISVFAGACANGATVIWDAFEQWENSFYYYGGPTPEINFTVETFHDTYIFAKADGPVNAANPRAYWVMAERNDVIDYEYILSGHLVLDAYYTDASTIEYHTMSAAKDSTFYLALVVDDAEYYGWLAIDVDGDGVMHLAHSALSTKPGIVVGAIPEPSGALLLLLGCAGLALRRRRMVRPSGNSAGLSCSHRHNSTHFDAM